MGGYILDANHVYVLSLTKRTHGANYKQTLKDLMKKIDEKKIKTSTEARKFVNEMLG